MLVEAVALLEVYFHVFRACIKLASFFNLFVFSFPNDSNTRHLVRGYKPVIFFGPTILMIVIIITVDYYISLFIVIIIDHY